MTVTIALADSPSNTGTYWYRSELPFRALRLPLRAHGIDLVRGPQPACDIYVYAQPLAADSIPKAAAVRLRGAKVVAGFDDHPWVMPAAYPRPAEWRERMGLRRRMLAEVTDHVAVTTHPLREAVGGRWRTEAVVLPNLIDPADYAVAPPAAGDPPHVVFAGSPSHVEDVKILAQPLTRIAAEYPDAVFSFLGCRPPAGLVKALGTDGRRLKWYPWVRTEQYPATLCALKPTIGLCPLIGGEFTRCKSNIKHLEFTLAGAATLVSLGLPPYEQCTALGCRNDQKRGHGWYEGIKTLLDHPTLRATQVRLATEDVLKDWSWRQDDGRFVSTAARYWEHFLVGLAEQ